jgi:hypothetical protein
MDIIEFLRQSQVVIEVGMTVMGIVIAVVGNNIITGNRIAKLDDEIRRLRTEDMKRINEKNLGQDELLAKTLEQMGSLVLFGEKLSNLQAQFIEHEARIKSLEGNATRIIKELAIISTNLKHITQMVQGLTEGLDRITDKYIIAQYTRKDIDK